MKFVAPEQAPEQAEIIRNTPFWPDVDLSEFRSVMRTDGTVTEVLEWRYKAIQRSGANDE
ncbi:TPA: head completion/stabilization protein [Escherichia coli]|nr:head completion/stabilization protein [Escherichia coli]